MALKIKKTILDNQGRIIEELEGTESEIESYMKKRQKREETIQKEQSKKKGVLLGKEMLAKIQELIDAAILKHALTHPAHQAVQVEHHWYHNNGWWWRPMWDYTKNNWYYTYTSQNPEAGGVSYITCNTAGQLSSKIGVAENVVQNYTTSIAGQLKIEGKQQAWQEQLRTQKYGSLLGSQSGDSITLTTAGSAPGATGVWTAGAVADGVTSGIINMNIKS